MLGGIANMESSTEIRKRSKGRKNLVNPKKKIRGISEDKKKKTLMITSDLMVASNVIYETEGSDTSNSF
jgi:hypothetical protein